MRTSYFARLAILTFLAVAWINQANHAFAQQRPVSIQGKVTANGSPLEGAYVAAHASGKVFTTYVMTDRPGQFAFRGLEPGSYAVFTRIPGFRNMTKDSVAVQAGQAATADFAVTPETDFNALIEQASNSDLQDSFPLTDQERDALDHRCADCHGAYYIAKSRFSHKSWELVVAAMDDQKRTTPAGDISPPTRMSRPSACHAGAEEGLISDENITNILTKFRSPDSPDFPIRFRPRATGQRTRAVITEYDIPRGDDPNFVMLPDGSDWSLGIASGFGAATGGVLHDSVPGTDGNVYFSDNTTPERTIGRLDPRTGRVTGFKLEMGNGLAARTHGAIPDPQGGIWFNNGSDGTIIRFDSKTETFQRYAKPPGGLRAGGHIEVDSKGNVFTSANTGIVKLNPATGEYTDYKAITPGMNPYGVAVDSQDNMWMAQLGGDRLMVANGRTGEVSEVVLAPLDGVSQKDIEIGQRTGAANNAAPLYFKGPRRLGGDPKGDSVWVAEFWAGRLARINVRTKQVKEYPLPSKYAHPYDVQVDKNQMVWINQLNSDRLAKFNPVTEQFTEYPLPSRGTETRHISVDDSTSPPTVWLAYSGLAKIARVQFRTNTAAANAGR